MNKFTHAEDGNFRYVRDEIVKFVEEAPDRVTSRFKCKCLPRSCAYLGRKELTEIALSFVQDNSRKIILIYFNLTLPRPLKFLGITEERDQASLNAIFITDPFDDMEMIEHNTDRLLEQSGSWVLSNSSFSKWINEDLSRVLWVHGNPGKGKTMLAISLIRELSKKIQLQGSAENTLLAYFFCDNKDDRRKTSSAILRGLIYQILCQRPDLCSYLRSEYERQGVHLLTSPHAIQTLWRILRHIIKYPNVDSVYIVIDALDECEPNSIEAFLSLLEPFVDSDTDNSNYTEELPKDQSSRIKWLLTSRNEDTIKQRLSRALDISLESNSLHVSNAVRRFIDVRVKQLKKAKCYDASLSQFVEETLRQRSEGTFLWVALACRELSKPTVRLINTKTVLLKLPSGLTPLYNRIIEQILGVEDEELASHAKAILKSMVVAFRPLNLQELAITADLPKEHHHDLDILNEYVNLCGSIVTTRQQTAYFVHQSAKFYILSITGIVSHDLKMEHTLLAVNCFQHISNDRGKVSEIATESLESIPERRTLLAYPVLFWLDHARYASDHIAECFDLDGTFFALRSKQRQDWLDAYWEKTHAVWEKKPSEFTALHLSAYAGLPWLASALLESGYRAHLNDADSLGNDPLIWAAKKGYENVVRLLVNKGANLATRNSDGVTALYRAAANGHSAVVQYLAENGASIDIIDRMGWTPLHRAAHHGHTSVVLCLVDRKADIEALDASRWTALQRACSSGQLSVVRILLENKANTVGCDRERLTLLHLAAEHGHVDITSLLLKSGANIEATDMQGSTPLQLAAWGGHSGVVKFLLQNGANVNSKNLDGNTALHHATWNGHAAVVRLLLGENADVKIACNKGETALQQAAWRGDVKVSKLLLDAGGDPHAKSESGLTALHQAASNGHELVVKLLLDWGADPTIRDVDGQTAYMQAKENHHDLTACLLEGRNAGICEYKTARTSDDDSGESHEFPLDSAIINILSLAPDLCKIQPHGDAGFSNPSKITAVINGEPKYFFMKTGPSGDMFESRSPKPSLNRGL
jgi:ankyrin repeat protein